MLARTAFYLNGLHVETGEQVVMDADDAGGSARSGLTAYVALAPGEPS